MIKKLKKILMGEDRKPIIPISAQLLSKNYQLRQDDDVLRHSWKQETNMTRDAEAELVAGLASEIALEIDRELIQDIRSGALSTNYATYDAAVPTGMTQTDWYRTLITVLTKLSNVIHRLGIRGPANWIVTSPEVSTIIEQLGTHGFFRPIFAPATSDAMAAAEQPQNFGVYRMGTLSNKWTVYKDVKFQSNELLLGYKGQNFVDAGFVFAPYIPLQTTARNSGPSRSDTKRITA
jgi:hypothetical protein